MLKFINFRAPRLELNLTERVDAAKKAIGKLLGGGKSSSKITVRSLHGKRILAPFYYKPADTVVHISEANYNKNVFSLNKMSVPSF